MGRTLSVQIVGDASSLEKAFGKALKTTGSFGDKATRAGKTLTAALTVPLVGLGAVAFKTAASFETAMNQVQAASGAPTEKMAALAELAKRLGADTVFSANEAAGAMLELAKSGMTPAQIEAGALEASLRLAAAGGVSLQNAATTAANAVNMFGLEAADAAEVANALAGGANASSASVESLQQALSQVGPGARNAGLRLQDTVGVLAAFADRGIQGSDAGTSLKTMLQRLVPTTDEAAKAMERYNLSFVDSKGNFDDVTVVAEKLRKKLGGLKEAERAAALQRIFGSDATRAAAVLMQQGEQGIRKYIRATDDQMAAQTMADARMKGAAGAIEQMKGSVETAALVLGQALTPMVVEVSGHVKGLADRFTEMNPHMQETILKAGMLAATTGPAVYVTGQMANAVQGLGNAAKFAATPLGATGLAIGVLNTMIVGGALLAVNALASATWTLAGAASAAETAQLRQSKSASQAQIAESELRTAEVADKKAKSELAAAADRVALMTDKHGRNSKQAKAAVEQLNAKERAARTASDNLTAAQDKLATKVAIAKVHTGALAKAQQNFNERAVSTYKDDGLLDFFDALDAKIRSVGGTLGAVLRGLAKLAGYDYGGSGGGGGGGGGKGGAGAATGLTVTSPQRLWVGEGGYREDIISWDPRYRAENIARLSEAASGLGAMPAVAGGSSLTVNVDARGSSDPAAVEAAARRGALAGMTEAVSKARRLRPMAVTG